LHYQPQVRLDSGAVVAVEALVRWFHADLGLISPAEFIPLAEETGLILDLGRWVLNTACAQVRASQEQGFELRLAVNLSGRQFEQDDLVRSIAQVIEATAFDPADLELELTESSIMRSPEQAVAKLHALNRLGIRLSIDDFGTGYSSLGHLKRFPIRTLKIDQSFIQDITTDPNDAAIAQAIIALAESLQLKVIAEGVETREQLDLLRRYHCDEMQGYLFARAAAGGAFGTAPERCPPARLKCGGQVARSLRAPNARMGSGARAAAHHLRERDQRKRKTIGQFTTKPADP
jgi:EAL domain-containing protein (putative c-di-GMP-specific phosphodiesterase class I)